MKHHHPRNVGEEATRKKRGRPSKFTPALTELICARIAKGESLRQICLEPAFPDVMTIIRWLSDDRYAEFRLQYARARELQADYLADEIIKIADECAIGQTQKTEEGPDGKTVTVTRGDMVDRAKLRVDARKWFASKVAPKKYGDRTILQGDDDADPVNTVFTLDIGSKKIKED